MSRPSEILMDIKSVKAWLAEADYMPVVRCKECKYWEYDCIFPNGYCRLRKQDNPDWFCADGKRKE